MTLTKADLVQKIYQTHNLTKAQATGIVEAFLKISKNCLASGDDLLISGFGGRTHAAGFPASGERSCS